MNELLRRFLASARSSALSPMEHAEVRATLMAHMATTGETPSLLQTSAVAVRLTDDERAIGRSRLLHFVRTHPLGELSPSLPGGFLRRFWSASVASAAAVALVGGGMVYAAEGALPGDLLYPVKTRVTEPFVSVLSLTDEKRAEWNVRTIERRLDEADVLNSQADQAGRRDILRSQMEQDARVLREHIDALPAHERRAIRSALLAGLTRHRQSLLSIQAATGIPAALQTIVKDEAGESENTASSNDAGASRPFRSASSAVSAEPSRDAADASPAPAPEVREGARSRQDSRENAARALLDLLESSRAAVSSSGTLPLLDFPEGDIPLPSPSFNRALQNLRETGALLRFRDLKWPFGAPDAPANTSPLFDDASKNRP